MPTWLLFLVPTLIWASTWHVILYQLGQVPILNSVAWRFALASLLLAFITRQQGQSLRLPLRVHGFVFLAGVVQYGGNYWAVYEAERFIPSGLVAVLFALMVFGNAIGAWWAFGQRVSQRFLLAALGGVVGVVMVFWPEIGATGARPNALYGLLVGLGAVLAACVGNMLTLHLTRSGHALLPVRPALALCAVLALPERVRHRHCLRHVLQAGTTRRRRPRGTDGRGDSRHRTRRLGFV
jgi:drug/metabolite transporter (DMT)-like permease